MNKFETLRAFAIEVNSTADSDYSMFCSRNLSLPSVKKVVIR